MVKGVSISQVSSQQEALSSATLWYFADAEQSTVRDCTRLEREKLKSSFINKQRPLPGSLSTLPRHLLTLMSLNSTPVLSAYSITLGWAEKSHHLHKELALKWMLASSPWTFWMLQQNKTSVRKQVPVKQNCMVTSSNLWLPSANGPQINTSTLTGHQNFT